MVLEAPWTGAPGVEPGPESAKATLSVVAYTDELAAPAADSADRSIGRLAAGSVCILPYVQSGGRPGGV